MTRSDLHTIASDVVEGALPGEQLEAYVVRSRETEVKVFNGNVESLSVAEVAGIGVRVIVAGRQGIAYAGSLEPDVIAATTADARDNAAYGSPDEGYGLAEPSDLQGLVPVELDLWRDDVGSTPTEAKVALAIATDRAVRAADPRVRGVESTEYGDAALEMAMVASTGVSASLARTITSVGTAALAGERDATQTGYGFDTGRAFADLDIEHAATMAAERATRLLGASQPKTQRLPVALDPLVTSSFLGLLGAALNGEAVLKGRSMFADRMGEMVGAATVSIVDDPTNAAAFGASPVDGEGVPTRPTTLVRDGRLESFLHNLYTARRTGAQTTGSAVRGYASTPGVGARALHFLPGTMTAAEVMAAVPEALYVQSVSGLHSGTNTASGDFSVGAEGLMVRDGQFAEPVREITIASTLQRMLLDVLALGSDLTWLPGGTAGLTLLIGDMTMAGG
ncbi:MAG: TldD/PmbA family protein [Acidimicrobiia bacterium]|nr:TldD/PmbA family protein [Acidimicrobiia bacterium]